jgi:hypothetical protein
MFFTDQFLKITDSLEQFKVEYIVIGGFAIAMHGFPRFTEDIDIFVKNTPNNLSLLHDALFSIYPDDECIQEITSKDLSDYSVIRYGTPENFIIDIIDKIGNMFTYDDITATMVSYTGHSIRIADVDSLIRMKQDTIRLKDKQDVLFLLEKKKEMP